MTQVECAIRRFFIAHTPSTNLVVRKHVKGSDGCRAHSIDTGRQQERGNNLFTCKCVKKIHSISRCSRAFGKNGDRCCLWDEVLEKNGKKQYTGMLFNNYYLCLLN